MQNSPFATFGGSIVHIITLVTGDLNFHETFSFSFGFNDDKDHDIIYDRSMAYFVWVLFLVLIPILLSNTLVSFISDILLIFLFLHFFIVNSE